MKIFVKAFFPVLVLLVFPFANVFAATTVYEGILTGSTRYVSVPADVGDVMYVSADWQQHGTCSSSGSGGTLYVKQSNLVSTTSLANAKAQGPGGTGCSSSVQSVVTATTTATFGFYSEDQYSTPSTVSLYVMKFSPDSGGGSSATTTIELPASATAFNLILTYVFAAILWIVVAFFVLYLVKRFTD